MPSERPKIRLLLDEHYPGWLADALSDDGLDTVALNAHRPELRGLDDRFVLEAAVADGRVIVTEDVSTFTAATAFVPDHLGVVLCHHARYPRTKAGLHRLHQALLELSSDPPEELGEHPVEWWLPAPPD